MSARILIADDNAVDCLAMTLTLNRAGHTRTEVAHSGALIRERMRERQFDLIVLDYHLDDGVAEPLLRLAEARQRKARILMVSGDEQLSGFAHRLSTRVVGFVHKAPGYPQALAEQLATGALGPQRRGHPCRRHWSSSPSGADRAPLAPLIGVLGARNGRDGLPQLRQEG